uniref:Uncharacterized protein n=1 Tax=Pristionchus pacificus TaxID=54126 RepID=A0A2A6CUG7_PRIPA|eukprot:PDM81671.1 hypothetical protein PRIPAC_30652 [Pristionchus pacificus]
MERNMTSEAKMSEECTRETRRSKCERREEEDGGETGDEEGMGGELTGIVLYAEPPRSVRQTRSVAKRGKERDGGGMTGDEEEAIRWDTTMGIDREVTETTTVVSPSSILNRI